MLLSNMLGLISAKNRAGATSYYDTIIADSPVAYWRLGESAGAVAQEDSDTYDMDYVGSPTLGSTGLINDADTAVTFNGSSQYAWWTGTHFRSGDTQGSIELWFKTSASATQWIFHAGNDGVVGVGPYMGIVILSTGAIRFQVDKADSGASFIETNTTGYNDGAEHHVVATSNGTTWKLYVDGSEASVTLTGSNTGDWFGDLVSNDNVAIAAAKNDTVSGYFNGVVDEVAIYSSVLSSAAISDHYNAGL